MNPTIKKRKRPIYLWHPSPEEEDEGLYANDDLDLWPFFSDDDELDSKDEELKRARMCYA